MDKLMIETVVLIKKIYAKYSTGGALHIVLDDNNVSDDNIVWCLRNSIIDEEFCDKEDRELFELCAINLLKMGTEEKRNICISKAFE
jgi:hypothetical protein